MELRARPMAQCHTGFHCSTAVAKAVAEKYSLTFPSIYNKLVYRKLRETTPAKI
jgi:hypothetical protein